MNEPKSLRQSGLDPKIVKTLALEGIETGIDLMSWPMATIADIKGIGKKALGEIYDIRAAITSEREAAVMPAPTTKEPEGPPEPPKPPPIMTKTYMVTLQLRHAEWIDSQVGTNQSASKVIEFCVRQVFGRAPNKPGRSTIDPEAGGGTGLAKENPHTKGRLG